MLELVLDWNDSSLWVVFGVWLVPDVTGQGISRINKERKRVITKYWNSLLCLRGEWEYYIWINDVVYPLACLPCLSVCLSTVQSTLLI